MKSVSSNAGDSGSTPGQGTKIPRAARQLHSCTTTLDRCSATRESLRAAVKTQWKNRKKKEGKEELLRAWNTGKGSSPPRCLWLCGFCWGSDSAGITTSHLTMFVLGNVVLNSKPAEQGNEDEVVASPFPTGYHGCQSRQTLVPLRLNYSQCLSI